MLPLVSSTSITLSGIASSEALSIRCGPAVVGQHEVVGAQAGNRPIRSANRDVEPHEIDPGTKERCLPFDDDRREESTGQPEWSRRHWRMWFRIHSSESISSEGCLNSHQGSPAFGSRRSLSTI